MKEITLGTPSVPAHLINEASKTATTTALVRVLNRVLPDDCQIRTPQDAWYVATIAGACATLVFPPLLPLPFYCLTQAKKGGKA